MYAFQVMMTCSRQPRFRFNMPQPTNSNNNRRSRKLETDQPNDSDRQQKKKKKRHRNWLRNMRQITVHSESTQSMMMDNSARQCAHTRTGNAESYTYNWNINDKKLREMRECRKSVCVRVRRMIRAEGRGGGGGFPTKRFDLY